MFEQTYGFTAPPFRLTPTTSGFFESKSHAKALSYLRYGLSQGEGFIVVTGDIGAGKSTVVNRLFAEIDQDRLDAGRIATTQIDDGAAVNLVLNAFGLTPQGTDKGVRLAQLEAWLGQRVRAGRRVLLVVDEAQNLPAATLEEIRMLSNLTVGSQPLLQTFLVGQPQFRRVLAGPDMEQLRQRVIGWCNLEPMTEEEVAEYVRHRLRLVGWTGENPAITDDALAVIHRGSRGVPRLVNQICNRILLYGALERLDRLDGEAANAALDDLEQESAGPAEEPRKTEPMRVRLAAPDLPDLRAEVAELRRTVENHGRVLRRLLDLMERGAVTNGARFPDSGSEDIYRA